jgi:hypothetical protein
MKANEIRTLEVPRPTYITPGDNTMTAVADNLGVVAGILLELVAQVAELNEFLRESRSINSGPQKVHRKQA